MAKWRRGGVRQDNSRQALAWNSQEADAVAIGGRVTAAYRCQVVDGWLQVQYAATQRSLCAIGRRCAGAAPGGRACDGGRQRHAGTAARGWRAWASADVSRRKHEVAIMDQLTPGSGRRSGCRAVAIINRNRQRTGPGLFDGAQADDGGAQASGMPHHDGDCGAPRWRSANRIGTLVHLDMKR